MTRPSIIRFLVWALPCFLIWKFLVAPLLVSSFLPLHNLWLPFAFDDAVNPRLVQVEERWVIESDIFKLDTIYPHKSYQPTVTRPETPSRLPEDRPENLMMGLAMTWLCMISVLHRPQRYLLQGSLLSCLMILLTQVPAFYVDVARMLELEQNIVTLNEFDFIVIPEKPDATTVTIVKALRDTLTFFSTLVLPVLISLWYRERQQRK